ncbi:MAG TPA: esterase-like activity of phytase family protein [Blastocatellia bacterium]
MKSRKNFVSSAACSVLIALALLAVPSVQPVRSANTSLGGLFRRAATHDVNGAVAEIVAATSDGRTLIYTNSADEKLGFVNIANPAAPVELAGLDAGGEPTSVTTTPDGKWALAVVSATQSKLLVVDLSDHSIETTINLGGQPDSIAVSPDGRYAAVVIENQRNETLNSGRMPQGPAGFLTIVDLVGAPAAWTTRDVALTGLAERFPDDPEPEFVDINAANQAAVTLQENNHIAIVNLVDGQILRHWTAGTTTHAADTVNNNNINFANQITNARREPDAIAWTPGGRLITANEGDYTVDLMGAFAGGRDFTIFSSTGTVVFEPGVSLEQEAAKIGHYPDSRSGSKGAEFEGAEFGVFNGCPLAFIGSERGDFVAVYDITDETQPKLLQLLPTGDAPEGLLAIPSRNLFVTSNEGNGTISIFELTSKPAGYPQVISDTVKWGALSGLALGANNKLYAVPDNIFRPSVIYTITQGNEALGIPAKVESELSLGKNYDLEGIAIRPEGGWWVASEGAGNAGQATATKNLLIQVNPDGTVAREVELPASVNDQQRSNGYEGVTTSSDGSRVFVAFQREWADDPLGFVKIGRYTPATGEWAFYRYPLDAAPMVSGAWVGLSEIVRINDTTLAVIERDNQQRDNAKVKRIYSFSIAGLTPAAAGATPPTVTKTLIRDLLVQDNFLLEKTEGLVITPLGDIIVVSDNDGAGETRLLTVTNPAFDTCLQDDRSGDVLRFNSRTGEYAFARCGASGFVLTGRASIRRNGCDLQLTDARLSAVLTDCPYSFGSNGRAAIRSNPLGPVFFINDRDATDNTCACR